MKDEMKDDVDRIADQVRDLIKYATEQAEEAIWNDTKRLAEVAFGHGYDCMYLCVPGLDAKRKDDSPPLTVEVRDLMSGDILFQHDPVKDIIDSYGDNPPRAIEVIGEAIASLEAGIQRLRDEAERFKAQS